jgi:hypothetical protein
MNNLVGEAFGTGGTIQSDDFGNDFRTADELLMTRSCDVKGGKEYRGLNKTGADCCVSLIRAFERELKCVLRRALINL